MASYASGFSAAGHPPPPIEDNDIETEAEDEVDQLDTDSDTEELGGPGSSSKKGGSGPSGERIPGRSLLPATRLENIIQADGTTGSLALSKEGLFILSAATEEFIKRMVQAGQREAIAGRRNLIAYRDMAATTQQYQEFMFLSDTVPSPIPLADALRIREEKERMMLEDDPAMAGPVTAPPLPAPTPQVAVSAPSTQKSKGKSRAMNGVDKTNGSASASTSRRERRHPVAQQRSANGNDDTATSHNDWDDMDGHGPSRAANEESRPARNGATSASRARPSPSTNGHLDSTTISRSETHTPAVDDEILSSANARNARSTSYEENEHWPGNFTGPASGFLQGPGGPFSRPALNPGRTIYSHQSRAD